MTADDLSRMIRELEPWNAESAWALFDVLPGGAEATRIRQLHPEHLALF